MLVGIARDARELPTKPPPAALAVPYYRHDHCSWLSAAAVSQGSIDVLTQDKPDVGR